MRLRRRLLGSLFRELCDIALRLADAFHLERNRINGKLKTLNALNALDGRPPTRQVLLLLPRPLREAPHEIRSEDRQPDVSRGMEPFTARDGLHCTGDVDEREK